MRLDIGQHGMHDPDAGPALVEAALAEVTAQAA